MDRNIEFDVIGVAEALHLYRLHVPPNQREYSWTEDEVKQLLQDLTNAMRENRDTYFLGTVVMTKCDDGKLEVADGQQRLATTTIILATMRDCSLRANDEQSAQSIENEFLFSFDRRARENLPKLTLNLDDNVYFKNAILERPGQRAEIRQSRRSHRLISQAASVIREHFAGLEKQLGSANFQSALVDWSDFLQKRALVFALRVTDEANAFVMFETLNARGLKTSQADLVKNYLFRRADDRLSEAQTHWSAMRGAIESVGEDDMTMEYLRLACCVLHGATRERDVMARVEASARSKTEVVHLSHFLGELSSDYAAILNSEHLKWNGYDEVVRKSIEAINVLGVTQIRPLMLSVARHFTPAQTATAFRRMVSWSVRFLIVGGRGGKLDEGYARLANEIYAGKIKSDAQLVDAVRDFVPSDAQFTSAFITARVSVSRLARYYLRSLEMTARSEPNPEFMPNDGMAINLEHILSQADPDVAAVETHGQRLGNLALLQADKNSVIGNAKFSDKRTVYAKSSFLLTAQVAEMLAWGTAEIEARQKTLASFAAKTWPL